MNSNNENFKDHFKKSINILKNLNEPNPNYDNCKHNLEDLDGTSTCIICFESFGSVSRSCGGSSNHFLRKKTLYCNLLSKRVNDFNTKFNQMFPGVILPHGNTMIINIEKRYDLLKEEVRSFPNMKVIIYHILNKCNMTDLANTITLPKSGKSQKVLKKLFEDDENTRE